MPRKPRPPTLLPKHAKTTACSRRSQVTMARGSQTPFARGRVNRSRSLSDSASLREHCSSWDGRNRNGDYARHGARTHVSTWRTTSLLRAAGTESDSKTVIRHVDDETGMVCVTANDFSASRYVHPVFCGVRGHPACSQVLNRS
jgi:hypothetical protein